MACTLCNKNVKPSSPCSPPSPRVPCSLCLHAPPLLCSCADQMADTLMGPVLSNGAGLEFDTLTPPISAACHQEPHRMLSGKCLYCLLEFLWWVWVSGYRRTWSSNGFEVALSCRSGLSIPRVDAGLKCYYGNILLIHPDNSWISSSTLRQLIYVVRICQ